MAGLPKIGAAKRLAIETRRLDREENVAIWGLLGLFSQFGGGDEEPVTRKHDLEIFLQQQESFREAEINAHTKEASPELRTPSELGAFVSARVSQLENLKSWIEKQASNPNVYMARLNAGDFSSLFGDYDPSGLLQGIWDFLRNVAGVDKPQIPRGCLDVGHAISAFNELIVWCRRASGATAMAGVTGSEAPYVDWEVARELLIQAEFLHFAAGGKDRSAAVQRIYEVRLTEYGEKRLPWRNAPEAISEPANRALSLLRDAEKAGHAHFNPAPLMRCFERVLMNIPASPEQFTPPTLRAGPITVPDAIAYLEQVAVYCTPRFSARATVQVATKGFENGAAIENAIHKWPPDDGWHFRDGQYAYGGEAYNLGGRMLGLLKRLAEARWPLTKRDMQSENGEEDSVRTDLANLRRILRKNHGLPEKYDPIPLIQKAAPTTWKLSMNASVAASEILRIRGK